MNDAVVPAFYSASLADAASYPPPRVPLLPYLNGAALGADANPAMAGDSRRHLTASGRAALARIALELDLAPGARVLLPAYHCPSMVEPFRRAGATLEFYPLTPALEPVAEEFARLLEARPQVAVFVDYFGLAPDNAAAIAAARSRGLTIVHDCAHALYALDRLPESDFAIASLVKFLAVEEGGVLQVPRDHVMRVQPTRPGVRHDIAVALRALRRRRAALVARTRAADAVPALPMPMPLPTAAAAAPTSHFDPNRARDEVCWTTATLLRFYGGRAAAERRRANFAALLRHTNALRGLRAWRAELPGQAVPYVFPVVLEHGREQFHLLRSAGIPLYRWEQFAGSDCPTTHHYRETLVQLPCHQDLDAGDLVVLMHALSRAAGAGHGR